MRTEHIAITYQLTFETAFHLGTGLRGGLVHRLIARNADDFLYVPGSTLKGVLRDRCEQLARLFKLETTSPHVEAWTEVKPDVDIVGRIFGTRFYPGQLCFDDAQMIKVDRELFETATKSLQTKFRAWQTEQRTQVSISRVTRTAQQGMLYTSEYGIRGLRFEGSIVGMLKGTPLQNFYVTNLKRGTFPLLLLVAGLSSIGRIGGSKSTGAGKVRCEIQDNKLQVDGQDLSVETLLQELPALDNEIYVLCKEEAAG